MAPRPLQIHNTLTGKKEPFTPLEPGRVKMYVCGVTPYDECHLGHARCYVTFDFIRRSLKWLGYEVNYVQNFTDIDDKIIQRARERKTDARALAETYINDYFEKMDGLNVLRADIYPRVTEHVPQIAAFIQKLIDKGAAYVLGGDVYYSVRAFPAYGKLSKRNLDELRAGARVDVNEKKRDPLDFALWKSAKPGEPAWDSPWGKGRPGWHIECSVMSIENLKAETFDIHGGGLDLVFPHHENEIAQAEPATGKTFVRYWIHNGFVTVNKEKMSKSLGNFFTLREIFAKYDPQVVRWMMLSQHYSTPLEFSDELLEQAKKSLDNLKDTLKRLDASAADGGQADPGLEKDIAAALADDFNAPKALAVLHQSLNHLKAGGAAKAGVAQAAKILNDVFGIKCGAADGPGAEIDALVARREAARKSKNWPEADRLRKELTARGVMLEDTPAGPRWWLK